MTLQVIAADSDSISPLARLRLGSSSEDQDPSPSWTKNNKSTNSKKNTLAMKLLTPSSHHHGGGSAAGAAGAAAAPLMSPSNATMKRDTSSMSCSSTAQSTESSEWDDSLLTHDQDSSHNNNNNNSSYGRSHSDDASTSQQSDSNSTITTKSGVLRYLEHMKTRINDKNKLIPNLSKRLDHHRHFRGGGKYDNGHDDHHHHDGSAKQDELGGMVTTAYRGGDDPNARTSPDVFLHEFECHQKEDEDDDHQNNDLVLEKAEQDPLVEEEEELEVATLQQSLSLALDDAALDAMMGRTTRMQDTLELPEGMSKSDIYVTVDVDDQAFGKGSQCISSGKNNNPHHHHHHIHNADDGPVDLDATADMESVAVLSPHQRRLARQVRASLLDDLRCVYTAHNDRAKLVLCVVVVSMPATGNIGSDQYQRQQQQYQPDMKLASTWRLFHADTLQLYEGGVTVVAQTPSRHRGMEHCIVHKLAPRAANDIVRRIAGSQHHDDEDQDDDEGNEKHNGDQAKYNHQYTGTKTKMDSKAKTLTKTDFLMEV